MKFVLRLKHWQLFLLTFGLPFLLYIFMFSALVSQIISGIDEGQVPQLIIPYVALFGFFGLLSTFLTFAHTYQLAVGLFPKLPPNHSMHLKRFYLAFFFPLVYMLIVFAGAAVLVTSLINESGNEPSPEWIPAVFAFVGVFMLFHFLAMFCMFYTLYFNAKSLKSVELGREATMNDYIGEFFLLWFSFIGIWLLQPRINKIFSDESELASAGEPIDRM